MARSLWPAGIHVVIAIIDGRTDLGPTRRATPDKSDGFHVKPSDVAVTVHWLSATAFSLDVRDRGAPVRRGLAAAPSQSLQSVFAGQSGIKVLDVLDLV